jgi:hypothetical protein
MFARPVWTVVSLVVVMAPSLAFAQASIAGTVKDPSGAVLPGATVEAASPTLIEKVRTAVTDGSGQYKIENLRPGTYSVTFALTGFSTVKRDGIELAGSFSATVNAEMKIGSVEETITVSGESPIVDVQSGNRQKTLSQDVLTGLPTGRTQFTAATLIPGMNLNNQDVGGTNIINTTGGSMTIHGSNANDQRVMIDGLSTANSELAGQASNFLPNMGSTQEMSVDYSSGTADQMTGGVRINMIPRDGGNTFRGSIFGTGATSGFQADNYDQSLKDRGLRTPNSVKSNYDFNPGFGGPLKENTVWFYGSARWVKTQNYVGGMFVNKNAGIQNVWTYDPDLNNPAYLNATQRSVNLRVTWQIDTKNKLSLFADDPANDDSGVDIHRLEPPPPRGARRPSPGELQVQRHAGRGSVSEVDHGDRAGVGQRRAGGSRLPRRRNRRADLHAAVPEHLRPEHRCGGDRHLCDGVALLQGRVCRYDRAPQRVAQRQRLPSELSLQRRRAESAHRANDAVFEVAAAAGRHRPVRAG